MTAGIAGFVNGLFQGMDWREERNDKARKRKIEDELLTQDRQRFEWEKGDQAYRGELRDGERKDRAFEESERSRALSKRTAEEAAWNATVDEMMGGGATAPAAPTSPDSVDQSGDVRVPAAAVPFAARRAAASGPKLGYGILGDVAGGDGREAVAGGAGVDRLAGPQQVAQAPVIAAPPQPQQPGQGFSILQVDPNTQQPMAMQPPRIEAQQRGKPASAPREMSVLGVNPNHQYGQPAGLLPDIGQLAARGSEAIRSVPNAIVGGAANVMNRAINPVARYATGMEIPLVEGAPFGPPSKPVAAGGADPAAMPPAKTPAQGPRPRPDALAYGAAPKTDQGTPMASFTMAREMGIIGKDAVVKSTPGQRDRAATGFVAAYQKEKIPAIVEHYLRNGEVEKAKAFQEWSDDSEVRAGMKSWAKAGHAFSVGDGEGFLDNLAEAYNVRGYADDGYSVDRSKSQLVYGNNGELLGAQITFIDDGTGREFVQNFEGINDLMAVGWGMLAPEKQFEIGWAATVGAKKADPQKIDPAKVMSAIESRSLTDPAFAALPADQKEQVMVEAFRRMASGSQAMPATDADIPVDTLD